MNAKTMWKVIAVTLLAGLIFAGTATAAGITVYEEGEKFVKIGGRIQLQYHQIDPDEGDSTDDVFFRRLRPYIEGSLHKDWFGKFQWDMGDAEDDNEIAIKDAFFRYSGIEHLDITVGNAYFPFSREDMTSSKKQQLVERTFVGDHNYGSPERNAGVFLHYTAMDKKLELHAAGASSSIDPDAKKLDFDTPVNKNEDFNEGWIFGGRVDYHPFGHLKMEQGDFKRELKATISLAAFTWDNDDDNNTRTNAAGVADDDLDTAAIDPTKKPDVDNVTGFEVSGALRVAGLSVDAEYNLFNAETIDDTYTGGIYEDGETDLENWAVEGGYMVIPSKLELVAGYQSQDADNYAKEWTRTSFGANWFIEKQDIKVQVTYRIGENLDGVEDADADEIFVQTQYVF